MAKNFIINSQSNQIRTIGRNTQGVRLLKLDDKAEISSVTKVLKEDEKEEDEENNEHSDTNENPKDQNNEENPLTDGNKNT